MRVIDRSKERPPCPKCGGEAGRHSLRTRTVWFLDGAAQLVVPMLRCRRCGGMFLPDYGDLAPARSRYGWDVVREAVLRVRRGASLGKARADMRRLYKIDIPVTTLHDWVERHRDLWRGKAAG